VGFIGCEPYLGGVSALLSAIAGQSLTNVRIGTGDARLLLPHLEDGCLGRVFVLFADPWPKRRHHRRRLISRPTLDMIARVLREGGELRFASDSRDYVAWTLERVSNHPAFAWTARRPGDWRVPPTDWVPTRYEIKAQQRGETCTYLSFRRHPGRPDAAGE
jgi:tRNA (guanine-N7-)-methyltransferase